MAKEQNPNRQKISLKDMNERVLPMVGVKSDKPFNQKAIDQLMASNPAIAARVGMYNQILEGRPVVRAAKGGFIFSPDELGNPRVKEEMKDNPEFSEFSIDQQDATANKMQQRFAQPQDRMRPARGYAVGGQPQQPPLLDGRVSPPMTYTGEGIQQATRTVGGGPSFSVTDMRDRSMDGNLYADRGGPQDLRFRRTAQPLQPDSKIARADTRRFGEQPNILNRVPYDPPMHAFQPAGGPLPLQMDYGTTFAQPTSLSYEAALNRTRSRDVKSPQEQASIDAALALGPGGVYNIPQAEQELPPAKPKPLLPEIPG